MVGTVLAEFEKHGYPLPPEAAARVAELEREIDERVAPLYRLTEEEIKLVEAS